MKGMGLETVLRRPDARLSIIRYLHRSRVMYLLTIRAKLTSCHKGEIELVGQFGPMPISP